MDIETTCGDTEESKTVSRDEVFRQFKLLCLLLGLFFVVYTCVIGLTGPLLPDVSPSLLILMGGLVGWRISTPASDLAIAIDHCGLNPFDRDGFDKFRQSLPRLLQLFQYLLDKRTRELIFCPAAEDIVAKLAEAIPRYETKGERQWLRFCFATRLCLLGADCIRVMILERVCGFAADLFRPLIDAIKGKEK